MPTNFGGLIQLVAYGSFPIPSGVYEYKRWRKLLKLEPYEVPNKDIPLTHTKDENHKLYIKFKKEKNSNIIHNMSDFPRDICDTISEFI